MTRTALSALLILALLVGLYPTPREATDIPAGRGTAQLDRSLRGTPEGYDPPADLVTGARRASGPVNPGVPLSRRNRPAALSDPRLSHGPATAGHIKATSPYKAATTAHTPRKRLVASVRAAAGLEVAIRATFYCAPPRWTRCTRGYPAGSMVAAISPDLRSWTGRMVRVRFGGRSVDIKVVDCDCATEHGIDLYGEPFSRLAPLTVGVLTVTLEVVG